jgi:hypothetical protein
VREITHKCYELKKGTNVYCGDCGFEMQVVTECGPNCKDNHCCETNDLFCCGKPMDMR